MLEKDRPEVQSKRIERIADEIVPGCSVLFDSTEPPSFLRFRIDAPRDGRILGVSGRYHVSEIADWPDQRLTAYIRAIAQLDGRIVDRGAFDEGRTRMPAIELYLERADELAQEVLNAWGINMRAGNAALLTEEFKTLLDVACRYRSAKENVDNHRQFDMLSERDVAEEKRTRQMFAETYKAFWEKHRMAA
jgi:hypothetical protein